MIATMQRRKQDTSLLALSVVRSFVSNMLFARNSPNINSYALERPLTPTYTYYKKRV